VALVLSNSNFHIP